MKHAHGAIARQRRTKMFQLIGGGARLNARKDWHREVVLIRLADQLAQRTPFREIVDFRLHLDDKVAASMHIEMKAIFWRASRDCRRQGCRAALDIGSS